MSFRFVPYHKVRAVFALFIAALPLNMLRILLYRVILRYDIAWSARIGFGTILIVDKATIGRAIVGHFNVFYGPFTLAIGDDTRIVDSNTFACGDWVSRDDERYPRSCVIGERTMITKGHHFDVIGGFQIGNDSWIAGCHSQFWTHGAGLVAKCVIGNDCYIGSAVRFAPGSGVGNYTLVSLGSVVTEEFSRDHIMLGGMPARIIKENHNWRTPGKG